MKALLPPPIEKYRIYIKKTVTWLNKLAADEHLSRVWLMADYACAVLEH